MNIVNLSRHDVIIKHDGKEVIVPPSGIHTRIKVEQVAVETIRVGGADIPILRPVYTRVLGLPPAPQQGTLYVASRMVCDYLQRDDILRPAGAITDGDRVLYCTSLATYPE
jgi:hypothetical protein